MHCLPYVHILAVYSHSSIELVYRIIGER